MTIFLNTWFQRLRQKPLLACSPRESLRVTCSVHREDSPPPCSLRRSPSVFARFPASFKILSLCLEISPTHMALLQNQLTAWGDQLQHLGAIPALHPKICFHSCQSSAGSRHSFRVSSRCAFQARPFCGQQVRVPVSCSLPTSHRRETETAFSPISNPTAFELKSKP